MTVLPSVKDPRRVRMWMFKTIQRLAAGGRRGGYLLRTLRGVLVELQAISLELRLLRRAIEVGVDRLAGTPPAQPPPEEEGVDISFVDTQQQAIWMDAELRLTQATGQPPTEEEVLAELERSGLLQPRSPQ